MSMKIIKENKEQIFETKKSKFIGLSFKVFNVNEIKNILNDCHKKYSDATHICYAYNLPNQKKYDDNGEPSGTAGMPILNILEKNNLCYTMIIVIRYFGGIKLGSNGLIRAYSNTATLTINDNIKELEEAYLINILEDYSKSKELENLLKDKKIITKQYDDKISFKAIIKKEDIVLFSNINYKIEKEIIV